MLCHIAAIPQVLAYCRENLYQLISDCLPEQEPETLLRHEVQRQLDLVSALGAGCDNTRLQLTVSEDDRKEAQACLEGLGLCSDQPFLLLHPGASAASRRYPRAHLQSVVTQLAQLCNLPLVLTGGMDDQALLSSLQQSADHGTATMRVARALSFGGLAALISKARLLIANNSAPAHLAAAMQTPVVVLYALTNPQHTPRQVLSKVLFNPVPCAPCYRSTCPLSHHECLAAIKPSLVLEAVSALLDETR